MKKIILIITLIGMMIPVSVFACTSVIISGSASPDGRPLMWKHRDTGVLDNRLEHFKGEKYAFVGLVNSIEGQFGPEVWMGSNTAGFSIMNTASFCLKDDDVPASEMDKEGVLMYRALEICATLSDFEHFLDTLSRPMGVEANFGCIDAFGGAAYYETDNDGYVKRDVAAMEEGYCVVTNFSVTGRKEDWVGVQRYETASDIFARQKKNGRRFSKMDSQVIIDSLSRSYEHQGDSVYINRYMSSSAMVIKGIKEGESPENIVLWTVLGNPSAVVTVPVVVSEEDHIPSIMKKGEGSANALLCDLSMNVKKYIYPEGEDGPVELERAKYLSEVFGRLDMPIYEDFNKLHDRFVKGRISSEKYFSTYEDMMEKHLETVKDAMDNIKF